MAVRFEQVIVTITGAATTGSNVSAKPLIGRILAIHLAYANIAAATTDVTIATNGNTIPAKTIMTRADSVTAGWFNPRELMQGTTAADLTAIYDLIPVHDYITVSVAQADSGTVTATILYED